MSSQASPGTPASVPRVSRSATNASGNQNTPRDSSLPHSRLYSRLVISIVILNLWLTTSQMSRLTLLSSLLTLTWFLTAHILEYTSVNSCRHSSPHLWWLTFGILCIMYIMVLEVGTVSATMLSPWLIVRHLGCPPGFYRLYPCAYSFRSWISLTSLKCQLTMGP
jgi:hypothetical protein